MKKLIAVHIFIILLFSSFGCLAQFYNGHQMTFGKNRVQYNDFYWSYYRFDKYDVYFNQDGREIATFTGEKAKDEILKIEERLNHSLNTPLIFLVYNKFSDFRQSNIGLVTGKDDYNIGGVTKIKNNKASLYFQGNHQEYLKQMRSVIAEVIITEMLYGNKLTDNFANSTMLNLPDWYLKGLASYLSEEWNSDIESKVKDGILNNRYKKFNGLEGDDAVYAGHSFWKYINDYYGSTVITDIIYLTKINKGVNGAIGNVLGISFKEAADQWLEYYNEYYKNEHLHACDSTADIPILKKHKAITYYYQAKANPDGDKIAYVSNIMGQYKVWLYDSNTGKSEKIFKYGHKLKQINDYTYPVIEWHPSGKILTIISEIDRGLKLIQYITDEDKLSERNLLYYDKILDFSYSPDGSKMVFSAVKESKTDIYVYDIASATSEQITNDIADDFSPRFIDGSDNIIFSSNRFYENIEPVASFDKQFDLFIYDYKNKADVLKRLTNSPYENEKNAFEYKENEYYYLNDKAGIDNLYFGKYDSTISFIDTAIHYRYFLEQSPKSNYTGNIIGHHFNDKLNTYSFINYNKGKYQIYKRNLTDNILGDFDLKTSQYQKLFESKRKEEDSLNIYKGIVKEIPDSATIFSKEDNNVDINHYVFEIEKTYYHYKYDSIKPDTANTLSAFPKIQIYQRTFYTDNVVSQVDFGFLNSTYQAFTGGAVYFNPGINALFKIGANDLLEDYKLIAGVRFSADFKSNEYLVSLENLKKKIDEEFIFHRQSFENSSDDFVSKTQTNKLMYIRTIPFNQVTALKGTFTARHDRQIYMSTDRSSLQKKDVQKLWAGIKFDYIFDNTISTGVNLYNGTRYKLFGEYYKQLNKSKTNLFVLGADFRHYQKIHRDLIFASRFAASTSFGSTKLIYYLGGVDNWTNFSQKTPTFIPLDEIPINEDEEYAYQAVATNLRGFPQNIRNGNSFALINTELRWPVIKYFYNSPINSSFWSNLQVVGFFDIGTAWSGLSPYSKKNAYDTEVIDRGSVIITVDTGRDPIVAGYGVGARTMFFGYFVRFDWAWGIENMEVTPQIFYFSLSLDF